MRKKDFGWVALGLELGALAFQKVVAKHPLGCTCNTCLSVELSIPLTVGVTLSLDDNDGCA